jgi:hypothetical protein
VSRLKHEVALGLLLATAFWAVVTLFSSSTSTPFPKDFAWLTAAIVVVAALTAWVTYRVGQGRASVAGAGTISVGEAIERFESRSKMLFLQAWFFLSLVVLLLIAGAGAV